MSPFQCFPCLLHTWVRCQWGGLVSKSYWHVLGYTCDQINAKSVCVLANYSRSRSGASSLCNNFWPLTAVSGLRPSGSQRGRRSRRRRQKWRGVAVTACRHLSERERRLTRGRVRPHLHLTSVSAWELMASLKPPLSFDVCSLVAPLAAALSPPLCAAKLQKLVLYHLPNPRTGSNLPCIFSGLTNRNKLPPLPTLCHSLVGYFCTARRDQEVSRTETDPPNKWVQENIVKTFLI